MATFAALLLVVGALATALSPVPRVGTAASHREAPLISLDPAADITDFFLFRSYEPGKEDRVALIMDVIPGEEPSAGPNYYNFDPAVLYAINVDTDADGTADDVRFEFEFATEIREVVRDLRLPLAYIGDVPRAGLPPITALDGPGSEGLGLRQKYRVTMVRGGARTTLGEGLIAVPSNVGPKTMPEYPALAARGVYDLGDGIRVFAGQRDDPFYIDLGAAFDTLNFRRTPPLLTPAEDADDARNPFGVDMLSGFNVHSIALEVPASLLTADGKGAAETDQPKLGAYANTSRRAMSVLSSAQEPTTSGPWVQVQRLANPLVNELIIGTVDKDRWNALPPESEAAFLDYYLNPRLALALELVFGVEAAKTNRTDLVNLLLKYDPGDTQLSELLRLDLRVPPTPLAAQRRLPPGVPDPAGDPAAWPNGRRPKDDVTDVAVRVVGGPNYVAARAGDGVNVNDVPLPNVFPFLSTPWDGRDRVHQNPPGRLPGSVQPGAGSGPVTAPATATATATAAAPTMSPTATATPAATTTNTASPTATATSSITAPATPVPPTLPSLTTGLDQRSDTPSEYELDA